MADTRSNDASARVEIGTGKGESGQSDPCEVVIKVQDDRGGVDAAKTIKELVLHWIKRLAGGSTKAASAGLVGFTAFEGFTLIAFDYSAVINVYQTAPFIPREVKEEIGAVGSDTPCNTCDPEPRVENTTYHIQNDCLGEASVSFEVDRDVRDRIVQACGEGRVRFSALDARFSDLGNPNVPVPEAVLRISEAWRLETVRITNLRQTRFKGSEDRFGKELSLVLGDDRFVPRGQEILAHNLRTASCAATLEEALGTEALATLCRCEGFRTVEAVEVTYSRPLEATQEGEERP